MSISVFKDHFDQYVQDELATFELPSLFDPVAYMFELGGKRIRPILAMTSYSIFSNRLDEVLPACLALELFHNFSLIHDDIMDASQTRRGKTAAHIKYGSDAAILSGDTMYTLCYKYLRCKDPVMQKLVMDRFTDMAMQLCVGQRLDMDYEKKICISRNEYLNMIEGKTAVLMAFALEVGAILGKADTPTQQTLYNAAKDIGISFQIKDDYLDLYGDPDKVGKLRGGDILRRKKSFLFVAALENLETADKDAFIRLYNQTELNPEIRLKQVEELFDQLNVSGTSQEAMRTYFDRGMSALEKLGSRCDVTSIQSIFSSIYHRMH